MSKNISIAPSAFINYGFEAGDGCSVGKAVRVESNVKFGNDVTVRSGSVVGRDSVLLNGVYVGPRVSLGPETLIMQGARICPNNVRSKSSDARSILPGASIGPNVLLHDEVEIGRDAVIPTQRTIVHIGSLGTKNRIVTIYGSDEGPRYSIGCQIGVDIETVSSRVGLSANTTQASAETYAPFLETFQTAGQVVQKAYEQESALVEEIRSARVEFGLAREFRTPS